MCMVAFPVEQYAAVVRVVDQEVWRRFRLTGRAFEIDDERQMALEHLVVAFGRMAEPPQNVLAMSRVITRRGILSRARAAASFRHLLNGRSNGLRVSEALGSEASAEDEVVVGNSPEASIVDRMTVETLVGRWWGQSKGGAVSTKANAIAQRLRAIEDHARRSRRPFDQYVGA